MGRLTTNIGLISGFPIADTVDKLIALQARPRDELKVKTTQLGKVGSAITDLATVVLSLQIASEKLKAPALFAQRTISSSKPTALSATLTGITGKPPLGSYQVTPLQLAQTQQLASSKFSSSTAPIGAGTFSFRFGGFVNAAASVDLLNGGDGVPRGKIRITDRSGAAADIDLTLARNVDDVLRTINGTSTIRVTAVAVGDSIRLIDGTGLTASNLKVEEVAGGATAAALGLAGINIAANQATGQDVLRLFGDLKLDQLNGGIGVRIDDVQNDLKFTFRDNTEATLDLHKLAILGTKATATTAAASANAKVVFTAKEAGAASTGVAISFVNDSGLSQGQETATYNAGAKTLVFRIRDGQTTADDVIAALGRDATASAAFTAARASGGNGTGVVSTGDSTVTAGPKSKATTPGTSATNAKLTFTGVQGGPSLDDVTISFVDNTGITAGNETVVYDDSNPLAKTLTFQIDAGNTTADQVIAALANDATARQYFTAARATGSNGSGAVSVADTVVTSGGAIIEPVPGTNEQTIGEVIDAINALAPTKLLARIAADGDRLELVDLTTDLGGTFQIQQLGRSKIAEDLGLALTSAGDTITGGRLLGGLQTSLLRNLDGGAGLDDLGLLSITDRTGATANVNLAGAETLDQIISTINAAGLAITAQVNDARNGITITDTSGATASNLIIANGDGTTATAARLGLIVNAAVTSKNGGSLHLQTVNEKTLLSSLNGGEGVAQGTFTVTDTAGIARTINVTSAVKTLGDLIDQLNGAGLAINARLNDAGDGLAIVDTAHGAGTLKVTAGNGATAANLHLLGTAVTQDIGGVPTQVLLGSTTHTITLGGSESLQDLVRQINAFGTKFSASIVNDGSSIKPFRFTLASGVSGKAGELLVDFSGSPFTVEESVRAQDALVLYGPGGGSAILASSTSNKFGNLIEGASLDLKELSDSPVTLTVAASDNNLVSNVQAVVEIYNRIIKNIAETSKYDADTDTRGLLQGEGAVLRVQTDLARLTSGRFFGVGPLQSLNAVGISINDDGTLALDTDKLRAKFAEAPEAVKDFFAKPDLGFSDKLKKLTAQLSGGNNSLLASRVAAIDQRITTFNAKIEFINARLDRSKERLLLSFQRMELAIAKIQSNQSAIDQIANLATFLRNQRS